MSDSYPHDRPSRTRKQRDPSRTLTREPTENSFPQVRTLTQNPHAPSRTLTHGTLTLAPPPCKGGASECGYVKAGNERTETQLVHLKQPAESFGPHTVQHDHTSGITTLVDTVDLIALASVPAGIGKPYVGITAKDAATALFPKAKHDDRNAVEKARRRLESLTASGQLRCWPGSRGRQKDGATPTIWTAL
jgi:hypothetical protein